VSSSKYTYCTWMPTARVVPFSELFWLSHCVKLLGQCSTIVCCAITLSYYQWLFFQNVIQSQPRGSKNPIVLYQEIWLRKWRRVSKAAVCSHFATVQLVRSLFWNTKLSPEPFSCSRRCGKHLVHARMKKMRLRPDLLWKNAAGKIYQTKCIVGQIFWRGSLSYWYS